VPNFYNQLKENLVVSFVHKYKKQRLMIFYKRVKLTIEPRKAKSKRKPSKLKVCGHYEVIPQDKF